MSLDVYLKGETKTVDCRCSDCGDIHKKEQTEYLYDANITHNLGKMAMEAGIYLHLWRPEEIGLITAGQLIEGLTNGLKDLKADPERFKKFNALNGWGLYEHFIPFVENYLNACIEYPNAIIEVSR